MCLVLTLVIYLIPIKLSFGHQSVSTKHIDYICVCLLSFPDWGEASVDRLQWHKLYIFGQPAICPDLLSSCLLRPISPHGPGLPAHLRHCHDPRSTDRNTAAGWLCPCHRDCSCYHREVLHFFWSIGALSPQDKKRLLLFFRTRPNSEQPHACWD